MFSICFLPTCLVFDSSLRGWLVAQNRVRLVPRISLKEFLAEYALFQKAEGAKVVFADGRDLAAFSSLQLADSQCFHVDMSLTDYRQKTGDLGKSETLYIVFCAAADCPWDDIAANRLLAAGANKVVVFDGGMKALFESGRFKIVGNKMHLND
jgi:rhodanese-related sulfurtransferase